MHLFTGDVLVAVIVVSVLAIISKVTGCGLPLWHEGWKSALQVGVGMMYRGEVALIVALVGLQSQIVLPSTYAIVVFMTGWSTILAPPCLRYLFHGEMKRVYGEWLVRASSVPPRGRRRPAVPTCHVLSPARAWTLAPTLNPVIIPRSEGEEDP